MKSRITAILLCMVLVLSPAAMTACGDGDSSSSGDTAANDPSVTNGADEPDAPPADETDPPVKETEPAETEYVYTPDPANLYQGAVGLGVYNTSCTYTSVKLTNNADRQTLLSTEFGDGNLDGWKYYNTGGNWDPANTSDWSAGADGLTFAKTDVQNAVIAYGESGWGNYNFTVKGKINEGTEGLRVYFGLKDEQNYYVFNCGGWSNTVATVEIFENGASTTTDKIPYTFTYGEEYTITVSMKPDVITGFINGEQLFQIGGNQVSAADGYHGYLGFATWSTEVFYDNISVVDFNTGEILYENDFSDASTVSDFKHDLATYSGGTYTGDASVWEIEDGMLHQTDVGTTGVISYFGDDWTNVIYTIEATPVAGAEGSTIIGAIDLDTPSYVLYNCGGWSNTIGCWQTYNAGTTDSFNNDGISTSLTYDSSNTLTLVIMPYAIFSYINGTFFQAMWK